MELKEIHAKQVTVEVRDEAHRRNIPPYSAYGVLRNRQFPPS